MDVTLGYDLNTCLLRSSDQSSLRQAPLPAGSFSMHVTPIPHSFFPSVSHSLSLPLFFFFFFLFTINSPSPGRSSTSHPFDPFLGGLLRRSLLIYSASPCFSCSLPSPLRLLSRRLTGPSRFFLSPSLSPSGVRGVKKGPMEMNE